MAYKAKNQGTKKELREMELQEFRATFLTARKKFTLEELEHITGIKASNLSAYGSGKKNPSSVTIEKFNTKLIHYMSKSTSSRKSTKKGGQSSRVEEERQPYPPKDKQNQDISHQLLQLLTATNDRISTENERNAKRFDRILDHNATLVDNNKTLADTTKQLANTNAELGATNKQIVDRLLSGLGTGTAPTT